VDAARSSGKRRRRRWFVFSNEAKRFWIAGLIMGVVIVYAVISTTD